MQPLLLEVEQCSLAAGVTSAWTIYICPPWFWVSPLWKTGAPNPRVDLSLVWKYQELVTSANQFFKARKNPKFTRGSLGDVVDVGLSAELNAFSLV